MWLGVHEEGGMKGGKEGTVSRAMDDKIFAPPWFLHRFGGGGNVVRCYYGNGSARRCAIIGARQRSGTSRCVCQHDVTPSCWERQKKTHPDLGPTLFSPSFFFLWGLFSLHLGNVLMGLWWFKIVLQKKIQEFEPVCVSKKVGTQVTSWHTHTDLSCYFYRSFWIIRDPLKKTHTHTTRTKAVFRINVLLKLLMTLKAWNHTHHVQHLCNSICLSVHAEAWESTLSERFLPPLTEI